VGGPAEDAAMREEVQRTAAKLVRMRVRA